MEPQSTDAWAKLLKQNWQRLSQTPFRDFYVASHPGWQQPEVWRQQAEIDSQLFLHGLDKDNMAQQQVLEIGCGVGRMAAALAPRFAGYTGFDIAPGMVAEARSRSQELANTRFFEGNGLQVPTDATDRKYHLILAVAVFIHCPKDVIQANVSSAVQQLAAGGSFRMQLRADPTDLDGIQDSPDTSQFESQVEVQENFQDSMSSEQSAPTQEEYYMGHAFAFAEAESLLQEAMANTQASAKILRFDAGHLYGLIELPS